MFCSKTLNQWQEKNKQEWTAFARKWLKESLATCTDGEHILFKKMYAHGHMHMSIAEVVDNMEEDRLDTAVSQVERTLEIKAGKQ